MATGIVLKYSSHDATARAVIEENGRVINGQTQIVKLRSADDVLDPPTTSAEVSRH